MAQQPYFKGIPKKKSLDGVLRADQKAKTEVIKKVVETAKPDVNPTGPVAKKYLTKDQQEKVAKRAPEVAKREALKNLTTNVTVETAYGNATVPYKGYRALDPDQKRALLKDMQAKIEAAEDAKRKPADIPARTVNRYEETKPVDVDAETKRILGSLESTVLGANNPLYRAADKYVQDAKASNQDTGLLGMAKGLGLGIAESTLRPASTFEGSVGNMYDPNATAEERLGAIGNAALYVPSVLPVTRGAQSGFNAFRMLQKKSADFAKNARTALGVGARAFVKEAVPFGERLLGAIDGPVVNDMVPAAVRQGIDFKSPRQADPASGVVTPPEPTSFADQQRAAVRDVLGADDVSTQSVNAPWEMLRKYKGSDGGQYAEYAIGGNRNNGMATIELDKKRGYRIRNIFVSNELQRKGYASEIYDQLNSDSISKTGKPLRSSEIGYEKNSGVTTMSPEAQSLWESLLVKGKARRVGDYYEFVSEAPSIAVKSSANIAPEPLQPLQPQPVAPKPMADMKPNETVVTSAGDRPVTGISNAANLTDFEQGILSRAPEGQGRSVKEILETNSARKDWDDIADRVNKGESYTADTAATVLLGKADYTARVKSAKDAIERAIVEGASDDVMRGLRRKLDDEIEAATEFAEKIQRGKSDWSDVGRTLATMLNYDTKQIESVLQEARIRKGAPLTQADIDFHTARVNELQKALDESQAEIARLIKEHADNATKVTATRRIARTPEARAAKRKQALDEFMAASSGLNAYVNPKVIKQFAKYVYTLIEDGARSVDDIVAAAAKDGVKADQEDVYAAFRSQVKESTLSDLQKEVARTKRELMAAAKADDPNYVLAGRRQMTRDQKIKFREGALRNQIAKLDKQIEQKKRFPKGAKIDSPEIQRLDAIRKEKQAKLDEITKPQKEAKAATDRAAVIQSQIDELKKKAEDGTLTAPERKVVDANIAELTKQKNAALKAAQDASIDYNMGTLFQKSPKLPQELSPEAKDAAVLKLRNKEEIRAWKKAESAKAKEESEILRNLKADTQGLTKEQRLARQKELDEALGANAKADNLRKQIETLLDQAEDGSLPAPKKREIDARVKALEIERQKALKAARDASPQYQDYLLGKDKERLTKKLKELEERIANKDYAEVSVVKQARKTDAEINKLRQKIRIKDEMVKAGVEDMRPRTAADNVGTYLNEIKLWNVASRVADLTANAVKFADFAKSTGTRRLVDLATSKYLDEIPLTKGTNADRTARIFNNAKDRLKADAELIWKGGDGDSVKKYGSAWIGGKAAGLTDVPFKSFYYDWMADLAADVKARKKLGKGADDAAVATEREAILANLDDHPDIQLMAEEYALNQTLNNPNWASKTTGFWRREAEKSGKIAPIAIDEFLGRFSKVITNVAIDAVDRTPVGILRGGAKLKRAKSLGQELTTSERAIINDMITKGFTGIPTALAGYYLGDKVIGTIKGERNKYIDYGDAEKIGGPMSIFLLGATMRKAESIKDPNEAFKLKAGTIARLPLNTPLASNAKDVLDLLTEFDAKSAAKYGARKATGLLPWMSQSRDIAERMDAKGAFGLKTGAEVERDKMPKEISTKTGNEIQTSNFFKILEADFMSRTPGLRQRLPIKKSDADKKTEKATTTKKKKEVKIEDLLR